MSSLFTSSASFVLSFFSFAFSLLSLAALTAVSDCVAPFLKHDIHRLIPIAFSPNLTKTQAPASKTYAPFLLVTRFEVRLPFTVLRTFP